MEFPKDTQADLDAFYSKHKLAANGEPTAATATSVTASKVMMQDFGSIGLASCNSKCAESN